MTEVQEKKGWNLSPIKCGDITRALRIVRDLKGKVYVVGGVVTEGETLRDIDIVLSDIKDMPQIKKALGKFAKRAHFMIQSSPPPATEYLKVTGDEPKNVEYKKLGKGQPIQKNEYAGS